MRRVRGSLSGLLLVLLAGCFTGQVARPPAAEYAHTSHASHAPLTPESVVVDLVLLECPVGDPFLNGDLWASTDEQVVPLEHKALLAENGFRVGQVVGLTPARLHALIVSDRYCVRRWRQILPSGRSLALAVSPAAVPAFHCQVALEGRLENLALDQAQAFLVLVPALTAGGRTRLKFTPQIQHGEEHKDYQPGSQGWDIVYRRYRKTYPELGWDVTVAPNEYVVIGTTRDGPDTLGRACFVQYDGQRAVQRLLVLRTTRPAASLIGDDFDSGAEPALSLATQVDWLTTRGPRP